MFSASYLSLFREANALVDAGAFSFPGSERAVSAHAQGFLVGWEMRLVAGRCLRRIYEGGNIYSVGKPAAALGQ